MRVKFKVDEDLPIELAQLLRSSGHDAETVISQGLSGVSDSRLWDCVGGESRCLITADKGFADFHRAGSKTHSGIILLRLPHESRVAYLKLVENLLRSEVLESVANALIAVSPHSIRINRR